MSQDLTRRVMLTGRTSSVTPRWWTRAAGSLAASVLLLTPAGLLAQAAATGGQSASTTAAPAPDLKTYADELWRAARSEKEEDLQKTADALPATPDAAELKAAVASLDQSIAKREADRAAKIAEVDKKLNDKLQDKASPKAASEALKEAVEMFLLVKDKAGFIHEPRIVELIDRAEKAAHEAEAKEDWFLANELFYRLHLLLEESGRFKPDVERLSLRLAMMRMYVPESFWKLRNDQRLEEGKSPLPPYNGLGESYHDRLKDVDANTVMGAIWNASQQHIDSRTTGLKDLLTAGLDALEVMMTTSDLKAAFPSLGDAERRNQMVTFLKSQKTRLNTPGATVTIANMRDLLEDTLVTNDKTVDLPPEAILHEFGNGAMSRLDDFSAIIWPDEVARFDRMTTGSFRGVGIQIQLDDESQMIKVVSPLEGTPAQRAGVKSGDFIKKINGQSAVGISTNQAIDLITGPEGTNVNIVMERDGNEVSFDLTRAVIDQPSVKGWRRSGVHEDDWDYFIDPEHQIGYVRISGFSEKTTKELRTAVDEMKRTSGLKGLIMDLRFNPGGLLTEAVGVSNVFIDSGTIVSTTPPVNGGPGKSEAATEGRALLNGIPVAVLINEGSASASEIVSGAIRHYADKGQIDAVVVGQRSFGKGSVQNVWPLRRDGKAKMRLTTQYYMLPDGHILHRKPGASVWGVEPHLSVDMLPQQTIDALKMRQEADLLPENIEGDKVETKDHPEPSQLITSGVDPQLQWALVLLQARAIASGTPEHSDQALRTQ
ncbi:MAG TPA: S41 family peptidase [Phycisphaerales bacterium]|nr:S41 family peptidase [Phycisphaerales bacterium]